MQVVLASTVPGGVLKFGFGRDVPPATALAQITGATYLQHHNINLKMQKKGITLSIKLFADPGKTKPEIQ